MDVSPKGLNCVFMKRRKVGKARLSDTSNSIFIIPGKQMLSAPRNASRVRCLGLAADDSDLVLAQIADVPEIRARDIDVYLSLERLQKLVNCRSSHSSDYCKSKTQVSTEVVTSLIGQIGLEVLTWCSFGPSPREDCDLPFNRTNRRFLRPSLSPLISSSSIRLSQIQASNSQVGSYITHGTYIRQVQAINIC